MFKKLFYAIAALMLSMGLAFAQVDVNKASQAELDGVKGIGPAISKQIVDERAKGGSFKDWSDLETRVKGIGGKNSAKMSEAGLTVGGQSKSGAPAAKVDKKEAKPVKAASAPASAPAKADAKAEKKASAPASAAAASAPAKADPKADKKAKAEADKKVKADAKAERKAKADALKKSKADEKAAKKAKADADKKAKADEKAAKKAKADADKKSAADKKAAASAPAASK